MTTKTTTFHLLAPGLVLHGGENGRGWAATIAETTGRMSAGIVTDEFAFTLFGTCTAS